VLVFALPLLAYGAWAVSSANPIFEQWMRQNQTLSPPVWDYLAAFGPLLILTAIGVWGVRRSLRLGHIFLLGWIIAVALLLYAPIGLQRRFAIGITVPLAILAGIGLWRVIFPHIAERWHTTLLIAVLSFTAPTTMIALAIPLVGARLPSEAPFYYMSQAEVEGLDWLQAHATPPDALVLASPEMGLFLPTRGLRVVYGHPFETLYPADRQREVLEFYNGKDCSVVSLERVQYIFYGPRERKLAQDQKSCPLPEQPTYISSDGQVATYAVAGQ
jgi:hypothetical protein